MGEGSRVVARLLLMDIDFDYLRNNKIRGGKCVGGNRTHASCSKIVNFRLDNELNN